MQRLSNTFNALKQRQQAAFISFITAGDPDYAHSLDLLKGLPAAGADIIELGMPFSDPMADGLAIQQANRRALQQGQTLLKTLQLVADWRQDNQHTPLVLMGYYNPIHHYGVAEFIQAAQQAGVDGLIVVDLPPEFEAELREPAQAASIALIRMITPATTEPRMAQILPNCSGFVYYTSITGITGATIAPLAAIQAQLERIRRHSDLPVCVGFGIKDAATAKAIAGCADGVVVGSHLVEAIAQADNATVAVEAVLARCRVLAAA